VNGEFMYICAVAAESVDRNIWKCNSEFMYICAVAAVSAERSILECEWCVW
jgi:hypothetical protein